MPQATFRAILVGDSKSLNRALVGAQRDVNRFQKNFARAAKLATAAAAGMTVAIGVKAVKGAADFEKKMLEVRTLLPQVGDQAFGRLQKDVLKLSDEMGVASQEVVPALYQAISGGVPKDNVLEFMRTAARGAIGGVTDLETSVDALTTIMNTWGKTAGVDTTRAMDVLFTSVKLGKTTLEELGVSINQVAGLGSKFGIGFEQVAAAFTEVTKAGVPTAEAMTKTRALMQSLAAPSTRAANALEEMGIKTGAARLAQEGFLPIIREIMTATEGNEAMQRKLLGSIEAIQAMYVLAEGDGAAYNDTLAAMQNSAGAADQAFETMDQGMSRLWQRTMVELNNSLTRLGTKLLPHVADAIQGVIAAGEWLAENWQYLAAGASALGVALAGVAWLKFAAAMKAVLLVVKGGGMAALLTPGGLVIGGLALLAAGIILAIKHWDELKAAMRRVVAFILESDWGYLAAAVFGPFGVAILALIRNFGTVVRALEKTVNTAIDIINGAAKAFNKTIAKIPGVGKIPLVGKVDFSGAISAFEGFTEMVSAGMRETEEVAHTAAENLAETSKAAWLAASTAAVDSADTQIAALGGIKAAAHQTVEALTGLTTTQWEAAYSKVSPNRGEFRGQISRYGSLADLRASIASGTTVQKVEETGFSLKLLSDIDDWGGRTLEAALRIAEEQVRTIETAIDQDGNRTLAEKALLEEARAQVADLDAMLPKMQGIEDWGAETAASALEIAKNQLAQTAAAADHDGKRTLAELAQLDHAAAQVEDLEQILSVDIDSRTLLQQQLDALMGVEDWGEKTHSEAVSAAQAQAAEAIRQADADGRRTVREQQLVNQAVAQVDAVNNLYGVSAETLAVETDSRSLLQQQLDVLMGLEDWGEKTYSEAVSAAQVQLAEVVRQADADGRRTVREQQLIDQAVAQVEAVNRLFGISEEGFGASVEAIKTGNDDVVATLTELMTVLENSDEEAAKSIGAAIRAAIGALGSGGSSRPVGSSSSSSSSGTTVAGIDYGLNNTPGGRNYKEAIDTPFGGLTTVSALRASYESLVVGMGRRDTEYTRYLAGLFEDEQGYPKLAKGGIVKKPTIALIGEAGPEAVIPLTGPDPLGTKTFNLNIEVRVDGSIVSEGDLADVIVQQVLLARDRGEIDLG